MSARACWMPDPRRQGPARAVALILLALLASGCIGSSSAENRHVGDPNTTATTEKASCKAPVESLVTPAAQATAETFARVADGGTLADVAIGNGNVVWSTIHLETGAGAVYE